MTLSETAETIGRNVRSRRERLRLSQHELSRRSGVGRSQITRLEAGQVGDRGWGLAKLVSLASALGADLEALVRRSRRHTRSV